MKITYPDGRVVEGTPAELREYDPAPTQWTFVPVQPIPYIPWYQFIKPWPEPQITWTYTDTQGKTQDGVIPVTLNNTPPTNWTSGYIQVVPTN